MDDSNGDNYARALFAVCMYYLRKQAYLISLLS